MKRYTISLISRIRERSSKFIMQKLSENGITGIVSSHGDIIGTLFEIEKCTMTDLAKKIQRTKATLTVLVDKLVAGGLVVREKSTDDSRVTYIKLTPKCMKIRPVFEKISEELNAITHEGLSEEEAEMLETLLGRVNKNFE